MSNVNWLDENNVLLSGDGLEMTSSSGGDGSICRASERAPSSLFYCSSRPVASRLLLFFTIFKM